MENDGDLARNEAPHADWEGNDQEYREKRKSCGLMGSTGKLILDNNHLEVMNLGNGLLRVVVDTKQEFHFVYCDINGNFIRETN